MNLRACVHCGRNERVEVVGLLRDGELMCSVCEEDGHNDTGAGPSSCLKCLAPYVVKPWPKVKADRYLLFGYDRYDASGGWGDFVGTFDTPEEAWAAAKTLPFDYADIIDLEDIHNSVPKVEDGKGV